MDRDEREVRLVDTFFNRDKGLYSDPSSLMLSTSMVESSLGETGESMALSWMEEPMPSSSRRD